MRPPYPTALLLHALVTGLLLTTSVEPSRAAQWSRPRIVNGVTDHQDPAVGMLLTGATAGDAQMQCTGTMVGCRTFVTAAHCVCDTNCLGGDTPDPSRFFVYLQHGGVFAAASIVPHPNYPSVTGADIAVIQLATPIDGITPIPINTSARPAFGSSGKLVGFGRAGGSDFEYGIKRSGAVGTSTCAPEMNDADWVCWAYENPVGPPGTDSNTCNGDSGGPLLIDLGSGASLAGVTSAGVNADCTTPDKSNDTDVFLHSSWIASVAGSDLAATSCGCTHVVGSPQTTVIGFDDQLSSFDPEAAHEIVVPAGTSRLRVSMNGVADYDLYVRAGALPTTATYDCAAASASPVGFCEFTAPAAGSWYVLAHRYSGFGDVQITATLFDAGGRTGAACDDANDCTTADTCAGDTCAGTALPDGSACTDGDPCTLADTCTAGACASVTTPHAGCVLPVGSGSRIDIRDADGTTRDRLEWRWRHGGATAASDFGDPVAGDAVHLCVFREATPGVTSLATSLHLPGGAGWRSTSKGFRWSDPSGAQDGVKALRLNGGPAGRATISLSARGSALPLPSLPIAPAEPVTVQLLTAGACFEASYPSPRQSTGERYLAIAE